MIPLFERYILKRATYVFFLSLSALVGTLWVTQVLRQLDVVTSKGQTIWTFVLMTIVALPALLQVVAPIAFLAAAIMTLNGLTNDSELPVIAAAGASRSTVNRPIIMLGVFVMLAVAFSYHVVAPASLAVLRELVTRVRADLIATLVQDGGFRTVDRGLTMHIRAKAPDGTFRDIFVSDDRNPNETLQYSASRGMLLEHAGGSFLVLQKGDMIRQSRESKATNVVAFDTYALDLSQLGAPNTAAFYRARERSTLYLLDPDPGDTFIETGARRVSFELNDRLASPLYALVFALAALAFLGRPRTNRQDRTFAIVACVLLCTLVRTAGFLISALARNQSIPAILLFVPPLAGMGLGLAAMIIDARLAIPRFVESTWDRIAGALRRLAGPRLAAAGADYDSLP